MPVGAEDGSINVWPLWPGIKRPSRSAASTKERATLILHRSRRVSTFEFGPDSDVGLGREGTDVNNGR